MNDLARVYTSEGKYAQTETYANQAVAARRRTSGKDDPDTLAASTELALIYVLQAKYDRSDALTREIVEADRKVQPDDWQRFGAESLLGASLACQKKYPDAFSLRRLNYTMPPTLRDRTANDQIWPVIPARRDRRVNKENKPTARWCNGGFAYCGWSDQAFA